MVIGQWLLRTAGRAPVTTPAHECHSVLPQTFVPDAIVGALPTSMAGYSGIRRKACCCPLIIPAPAILPLLLMELAPCKSQPELAGMSKLRSVIPPFAVQMTACVSASPGVLEEPTIRPTLLIELA